MLYVADEFSKEGKGQYQAAVKDFRLPYWGEYSEGLWLPRPRLGQQTMSSVWSPFD
jgi:hypothetical protein